MEDEKQSGFVLKNDRGYFSRDKYWNVSFGVPGEADVLLDIDIHH